MADVDYDTPRATTAEPDTMSLELLQERRAATNDFAETDFTDGLLLPVDDLLDEELTTTVVPIQPDEFRCGGCFLVLHRVMSAGLRKGEEVCRDCA